MKIINIRQLIIILIFLFFAYLLLIITPTSAKLQGLIITLIIAPLFIKLIWLLANTIDNNILFKEFVNDTILKGICPFCNRDKYSNEKLRVGYHKTYWDIYYKVFFIEYSKDYTQLTTLLPICLHCKNRYLFLSKYKILTLFARNPSKKVL